MSHRRVVRVRAGLLICGVMVWSFALTGADRAAASQTFTTVGADTFTVPAGVVSITIDALGAEGGSADVPPPAPSTTAGGKGGEVVATLAVTPGEVLDIRVGGSGPNATMPGYNGGATGAAGGGGASDVSVASSPLVIAGGGGGAGAPGNALVGATIFFVPGGAGGPGGAAGGDGGGTQSLNGGGGHGGANGGAGGPGGTGSTGNGEPGSAGTAGAGGAGGANPTPGGGGGGGALGGGGGGAGGVSASPTIASGSGGGGGGGSSFAASGLTGACSGGPCFTDGVHTGDGSVTITFDSPVTTMTSGPGSPGHKAKTTSKTPTFKFTSDVDGSTFACSMDGVAETACTSPYKSAKLKRGLHTLTVKATAPSGNFDATPATATFKVK